jgi:hypothetical protein
MLQEDCPGLRGGFGSTNMGDVTLDGVFGNRDAKFEEFATNAFSAPEPILLCHLLNQGGRSRRPVEDDRREGAI